MLDKIALEVSVWQRCRPLQLALTAHQLLRRREGVSIFGDIAPSQEAFFLSLCSCWTCRTGDALPTTLLWPWSPMTFIPSRRRLSSPVSCSRRGIWTCLRSSSIHCRWDLDLRNRCALYPGLLTALAASLGRLWHHNAPTLHTSWTVQELIAAEARILESINCEVGTDTPADWVHLLAACFSLLAEQLRQRTPPAERSPLSLTAVPADVMALRSVATPGARCSGDSIRELLGHFLAASLLGLRKKGRGLLRFFGVSLDWSLLSFVSEDGRLSWSPLKCFPFPVPADWPVFLCLNCCHVGYAFWKSLWRGGACYSLDRLLSWAMPLCVSLCLSVSNVHLPQTSKKRSPGWLVGFCVPGNGHAQTSKHGRPNLLGKRTFPRTSTSGRSHFCWSSSRPRGPQNMVAQVVRCCLRS